MLAASSLHHLGLRYLGDMDGLGRVNESWALVALISHCKWLRGKFLSRPLNQNYKYCVYRTEITENCSHPSRSEIRPITLCLENSSRKTCLSHSAARWVRYSLPGFYYVPDTILLSCSLLKHLFHFDERNRFSN